MATYSIQQYRQKIQSVINDTESFDAALFTAAKSAQAIMVERIFERGKDANENDIGKYNDTNPLYMSDEDSPKAGSHLGKPNSEGQSKKINTTYYSSYKEFRSAQGRESGFVNLRLFNRLQSDIANSPVKKEPLTYAIVVSRDSKNKIDGNEFRFGKKIFIHTLNERRIFKNVLSFEISKRFD